MKTRPPRRRAWIYWLAATGALAAAFLIYTPALAGPFVFDDFDLPYHLENYPQDLQAWVSGVRPLLMASFWVNRRISPQPFGFHVTNLILHVLNSFLIFLIVRKLASTYQRDGHHLSAQTVAGIAAAVFLMHPIQTESVAYIAGRSECLSAGLLLAAFAVFLQRWPAAASWKTVVAVLLLFAAAAATKEHALVLPGLLLLTDYFWNPGFTLEGIRRNWRMFTALAVAGVAGTGFIFAVLRKAPTVGFSIKEFTWYQYFWTECRACFLYLRLLLFPIGQNADWDFAVSRSVSEHGAIFAVAGVGALIASAICFRKRYPLACYGLLVFILLLAPTSSFIPIKDPVAERRLYLPIIGMLLVFAEAIGRIPLNRRIWSAAAACLLVTLAVLSYQRNQVWASDLALWQDTVAKSPNKARVHFQLGFAYYSRGRCRQALAEYAQAGRLQAASHHLLTDMALAYDCLGQVDEALVVMRQAVTMHPAAHTYSQLARLYARQARWPEALDALREAERIDWRYAMLYYYRAGIRVKTNDLAGALADYQLTLELDPANQPARQALAQLRRQIKGRP